MMCDFHSAMQKFIAQGFAFKVLLRNAKKSLPCKALHLNCCCGKHSEALSLYVHFHSAMRKFIAQFHKMCAFSFCHAETDSSSFPNLEFEVAMHN